MMTEPNWVRSILGFIVHVTTLAGPLAAGAPPAHRRPGADHHARLPSS